MASIPLVLSESYGSAVSPLLGDAFLALTTAWHLIYRGSFAPLRPWLRVNDEGAPDSV